MTETQETILQLSIFFIAVASLYLSISNKLKDRSKLKIIQTNITDNSDGMVLVRFLIMNEGRRSEMLRRIVLEHGTRKKRERIVVAEASMTLAEKGAASYRFKLPLETLRQVTAVCLIGTDDKRLMNLSKKELRRIQSAEI